MLSFVGGVLLSPYKMATRTDFCPPKRAHAPRAADHVVAVQRAARMDVADVVRVRRVRRKQSIPYD